MQKMTPEIFISQLYRQSSLIPLEEFSTWALNLLQQVIPFDGAVWATGHVSTQTFHTQTNIDVPEDKAWETFINLKIIPNPEYSFAQQQLIAREWGMNDMSETVTIRAALAQYYLILMHIPYRNYGEGMKHRVILGNIEDIKPYLMPS